jgi:hypothetical protein
VRSEKRETCGKDTARRKKQVKYRSIKFQFMFFYGFEFEKKMFNLFYVTALLEHVNLVKFG